MSLSSRLDHWFSNSFKSSSKSVEGQFLKFDAGLVRVVRLGSRGPFVLLSPDPPYGLEHYSEIIKELSRSFQVIAFEPPGFGFSSPSSSYGHSLPEAQYLLEQILDAHGAKSAILALGCLTGYVGLMFASGHPDRVSGFTAVQVPCWDEILAWKRRIDPKGITAVPILGQAAVRMFSRSMQKNWMRVSEPSEALREKNFVLHEKRLKFGLNFSLASILQAFSGRDPLNGRQIDIPGVVLWGKKDPSYRHVKSNTLSRYFSNGAKTIELPGGHTPEISHQQIFIETIAQIARSQ